MIWISPVVMTVLGIVFLFLSDEKPWVPWLAYALAIVGVIAAIVETRKVKARSAQPSSDS